MTLIRTPGMVIVLAIATIMGFQFLTCVKETSYFDVGTSDMVYEAIPAGLANVNDKGHDGFVVDYNKDDTAGPLNPAQITHVYHVGRRKRYGRSNNQIITILHAVDMALDEHGDPPNNRAVIALSTWAFKVLKTIFYNGLDGESEAEADQKFALELEQLRPVMLVHSDRLEALGLTDSHNKTQVNLKTQNYYVYTGKEHENSSLKAQIVERRRRMLWGQLLVKHGVADKNLVLSNAVRDVVEKRSRIYGDGSSGSRYATIHSRWLEGECERRVGNILPAEDECWMTPSYIKAIMGGTIDMPIVFIGDGQKLEVLENLKKDPDIGPALIVAGEITLPDGVEAPWWTQPWNDMMVAIMGDIFIGTRVSTFATMTGLSRVMRGADPGSNYIYARRSNSTEQIGNKQTQVEVVEVCKECLFYCNQKQSNFCGNEVIFS